MRSTTASGPLAALFKLLATFLLVHLLAGHGSAFPFKASSLAVRDPLLTSDADQLDTRSLYKRSNCQAGADPDRLDCDGEVTGVDEIVTKVQEYGTVGSMPSVFYTGYPIALSEARRWAKCFWSAEPDAPSKDQYLYALWYRLVDKVWFRSEQFWLTAKKPDDVSEEDNDFYRDLFLKHLAQAFAEESAGDVYLVVGDETVPDDKSWDENAAWGGWEWPALTRNSKVKQIFRVDPSKAEKPRLIWTSADGPQGIEPKGIRDSTPQKPR